MPNEKLPPRLAEIWKEGFCGAIFCWLPNWKGLAPGEVDAPNTKFDWGGAGCWPNTEEAGGVPWTVSSAIPSSILIWLLTGAEPSAKAGGVGLPKACCVDAAAEVNENWGVDALEVDKNIVVELAEAVDVPRENPDEDKDDELNVEPNGDLLGCQLDPKGVELVLVLELKEFTAELEAEVLSPKVVPELKTFVAGLEGNNELPEEKAGLDEGEEKLLKEKVVFPVNPYDREDVDEPNGTDWVWVQASNPLEVEAWAPSTEPLLAPTTELDWLFTVLVAEELKPKILFPADELLKAELLRLPTPASWLLLVSSGSKPEDDTGKPADGTGEDPNLKMEVVGHEDATTIEELLLLDAIVAGVIVAMLLPLESAMALMPLILAADKLLNIFWPVKLRDTGGGKEEKEGLARDPLFWFELWPKLNILLFDAADELANSDALTEDPVSLVVSALPLSYSRAFGIESVAPATAVVLHMKGTHSAHQST